MSGASHRSSGSGYTEFLVINRLKEVNRDFLSKPETLGGFLIACDFCFLAVARRCARQCQRRHSTPGYYGVLPIQGVTPSLWNANPIVAIGAALAGAPIYLTVPDNHRRHWRRYCAEYGACGVPVYFVKRSWYNKHYRHAAPPPPRQHARPKHDRGPGWDHRPPPRGPHACPRPAKSHDWNDHRGLGRKRGHHKDD